jgi:hypothetical protein
MDEKITELCKKIADRMEETCGLNNPIFANKRIIETDGFKHTIEIITERK